jgi:secondary thiamine-phosphate synthase enzyme
MNYELTVPVHGQGLYDITHKVVNTLADCDVTDGLATIFIRHTSASLVIQENADASARHDLERWLNRLVPENDTLYTHTVEGPDDMPAHVKAALTAVSVSVPIVGGALALGTWQGIFLWEHRHHRGERRLIINVLG